MLFMNKEMHLKILDKDIGLFRFITRPILTHSVAIIISYLIVDVGHPTFVIAVIPNMIVSKRRRRCLRCHLKQV